MSDAFAGGMFLIIIVLAIAGLAFWIWALIDAIRVPDDRYYKSGTKLVWVLVIVLVGWIGAIIYLAAGRPDGGAAAAIAAHAANAAPPATGGGSAIPPPPA